MAVAIAGCCYANIHILYEGVCGLVVASVEAAGGNRINFHVHRNLRDCLADSALAIFVHCQERLSIFLHVSEDVAMSIDRKHYEVTIDYMLRPAPMTRAIC